MHYAIRGGVEPVSKTVYRSADATPINASTVLVLDTTLQVSVVANGVYEVDGQIIYDASQAGDIKFQIQAPSGAEGFISAPRLQGGAASNAASYNALPVDPSAAQQAGGAAVGTNSCFDFHGVYKIGANAGVIQVAYAQQTSDATNMTVHKYSYLKVKRIA